MYTVRHAKYTVRHAMYTVRHAMYTVRHTMYTVRHAMYTVRHAMYPSYSCQILMELEMHRQIIRNPKESNFKKIRPEGDKSFHADGR